MISNLLKVWKIYFLELNKLPCFISMKDTQIQKLFGNSTDLQVQSTEPLIS